MGENAATKNNQHHQVFDVSIDVLAQNGSKCFDDDGRLKRSGKYPQYPVWLLPKPFSFFFFKSKIYMQNLFYNYFTRIANS